MTTGPSNGGAEALREAYADTLSSVTALASALDDGEWELPTGCPGWNVHDVVAHVSATESLLIGREPSPHRVRNGLTHVRNPLGEFMEVGVDLRRDWPPARLRAELEDVTATRLRQLEMLRDDQLDDEIEALTFKAPARRFLGVRIFDVWAHEQDIRRATYRPGGLDGPAGLYARDFMLRQASRAVQSAVEPATGTTIRLELTGDGGGVRDITFDGRRGTVHEADDGATATLRMDVPAFAALCCGRDDPGARKRVELDGDVELGGRVLASLAFTP
jgi:uncharacterized protein (TIGR03083 family)